MAEVTSTNCPFVSVIIAVKNGERFLTQAIESVLQQSYHPIELIVVDGQSTDRTAAIAQSFAEVRYVCQEDTGVANAYNLGITMAQGELIAFLSHDDLWTPQKLSTQVNYLLAHPDVAYTIGKIHFFVEPGCLWPTGLRSDLLDGEPVAPIMETLLARRQLFAEVGLHDQRFCAASDVDWFVRCQERGIKRGVIEQVLVHKRIHQANTSLNERENLHNVMSALHQSVVRRRKRLG